MTPTLTLANAIKELLDDYGWDSTHMRVLPDGGIYWVHQFIYTAAILMAKAEDYGGYQDRWCFHSVEDAARGLMQWNPEIDPEPTGWHRHPNTGRRRPDGDAFWQYIDY